MAKEKEHKIKNRFSIRTKLVLVTGVLVLFAVLSCVAVNLLFIETYYTSKMSDKLVKGRELLNQQEFTAYDEDAEASTTELPDEVTNYFEANNLIFLVMDENQHVLVSNEQERGRDGLRGRLFGYMTGLDKKYKPTVLDSNEDYTIQKNNDFYTNEIYVELWGDLDDGNSLMIRTPMASIRDSADIANHFFLVTGLVMVVFSAILIWIFMDNFTRPVRELTILSEKMSNLDFTAKYESGGQDEIGVLGHNFNKMSEELERTIADLKTANLELQKDIKEKEEIDEMRKEFLSNVSHELKTPIALIQGYGEGLLDNVNEDPESRTFYAEVIVDEARKMNTMVKKLLSLNQLEFGKDPVEMECFDLTAIIDGVCQSAGLMFEQKGATLHQNQKEPLYVWGDEFKVEQVMTNYISNALNHVDGDKIIDVRCKVEKGLVKTSVFNTGERIPDEDLDKIWIKFYKVDKARTRAYGGSGIGLSIVKAIMDGMNQKCGVENYANGVEFWFTLEHREKNNK